MSGSDSDNKRPTRNLKSCIGSTFFAIYNFLPVLMVYIYYKAFTGNLVCIALSIIQIIAQATAKKSTLYRKFLTYFSAEYFFDEYTLKKEEELAPEKTLLAVHPHNVYTVGLSIHDYAGRLGNQLICGSRMLLYTPLLGLVHKWGGVTTVDAANLKSLMSKNKNISILPGGFEEATLTTPKENRVFIKSRKGFIKYALRYGYNVHPVYIFNENKIFYTLERFEKFRLLLNKLKLVGVIFWSRFGCIPEPCSRVNTVVGKAIKMPQIDNPTDQDVDKYHEIYVNALQDLFDRNKALYGQKDEILKIY
ncbi:hypothetical protein ABPG74_001279 [Tetrahymena malaccensis]